MEESGTKPRIIDFLVEIEGRANETDPIQANRHYGVRIGLCYYLTKETKDHLGGNKRHYIAAVHPSGHLELVNADEDTQNEIIIDLTEKELTPDSNGELIKEISTIVVPIQTKSPGEGELKVRFFVKDPATGGIQFASDISKKVKII